ncbi:MAG TPA: hypothetical protein VHX15_16000 [Frankiaceae bacterium]|nr:hypothetical protein [Frankiaceae bacterium]
MYACRVQSGNDLLVDTRLLARELFRRRVERNGRRTRGSPSEDVDGAPVNQNPEQAIAVTASIDVSVSRTQ